MIKTPQNIINSLKYIVYLAISAMICVAPAAAGIVSVEARGKSETISLEVNNTAGHKVFTLGNPNRLVVDVPAMALKPLSLPKSYDGNLIKAVRAAQFNPQTLRFVFDLNAPVKVEGVNEEEGRLVIEISQAGAATGRAPLKNLKSKKPPKPVVVIDAGHGGVDPGTSGPKGTLEKDVVLEYARALQSRLIKSGKYKVVMTREGDTFIMLRKRVEIARKAGGSIFISLHADSAPDMEARGLSVYTVSEKASDQEAEALAARENKADVLAGIDLSSERGDVAGILISLAQRETKNNSATLADILVMKLDEKVRLLENTHRFAGFAVLKAPDIPSVLIEIGFLSHPAEEKLIKSRQYRDRVISGIASGIDSYFEQISGSETE